MPTKIEPGNLATSVADAAYAHLKAPNTSIFVLVVKDDAIMYATRGDLQLALNAIEYALARLNEPEPSKIN